MGDRPGDNRSTESALYLREAGSHRPPEKSLALAMTDSMVGLGWVRFVGGWVGVRTNECLPEAGHCDLEAEHFDIKGSCLPPTIMSPTILE